MEIAVSSESLLKSYRTTRFHYPEHHDQEVIYLVSGEINSLNYSTSCICLGGGGGMETVCFVLMALISNDVLELCVLAASRERSRWRICPRWYRSLTPITNSTFYFTSTPYFPSSLLPSHPLNNMWYPVPVLFRHIRFFFVPAREIKWPQVNKYVRDNSYVDQHGRKLRQKMLYRLLTSFNIEFNTECHHTAWGTR
jgi:hypothetical protein